MIDEQEIRVSRDVGGKLTGGITNFSIETSTRYCVYHYTGERTNVYEMVLAVIYAICTDINCFDRETERFDLDSEFPFTIFVGRRRFEKRKELFRSR